MKELRVTEHGNLAVLATSNPMVALLPREELEARNHAKVTLNNAELVARYRSFGYRSARASSIIRFPCELACDFMARCNPAFSA